MGGLTKNTLVQDLLITWKGKKISTQELNAYLETRGLTLPPIFKNFLLTYNGCAVRKSVFKREYAIASILPLSSQRVVSIELILDSYEVDLNIRHLFPFAIDPENRIYVLPLVGSRAGEVWLDRNTTQERFEFLSPSFEDFIEGLDHPTS